MKIIILILLSLIFVACKLTEDYPKAEPSWWKVITIDSCEYIVPTSSTNTITHKEF